MPPYNTDLLSGGIGFGMFGLTSSQDISDGYAISMLKDAFNAGCCVWNGGEFYGTPERNSLTLIRKYFEMYPDDADNIIINIKGGLKENLEPDGRAEAVTKSALNCVDMLGPKGFIHMFECARRDTNVPLEETIGALSALVETGKIGSIALSEVNATTIREAAKLTKISAVEVELSLWSRGPLKNGIKEACYELGIPILAYSPLGRGFLGGEIKSLDDIPAGDIRRMLPRFQPENFEKNMKLVRAMEELADRKGCTLGQLAINWVRCLSDLPGHPVIIPIPGTTNSARVGENATEMDLSIEEMVYIQEILDGIDIAGDRYPPALAKHLDA